MYDVNVRTFVPIRLLLEIQLEILLLEIHVLHVCSEFSFTRK